MHRAVQTVCVAGEKFQMSSLAGAEVDVIVGTPKSVIQMCKMDVVNLNAVQFTVLVETARMLAVAVNDVGVIMEKLPTRCQRIMFSAGILSPNIRKFAKEYFRDLLTIDLVGCSMEMVDKGIKLFKIEAPMEGRESVSRSLIKIRKQKLINWLPYSSVRH